MSELLCLRIQVKLHPNQLHSAGGANKQAAHLLWIPYSGTSRQASERLRHLTPPPSFIRHPPKRPTDQPARLPRHKNKHSHASGGTHTSAGTDTPPPSLSSITRSLTTYKHIETPAGARASPAERTVWEAASDAHSVRRPCGRCDRRGRRGRCVGGDRRGRRGTADAAASPCPPHPSASPVKR